MVGILDNCHYWLVSCPLASLLGLLKLMANLQGPDSNLHLLAAVFSTVDLNVVGHIIERGGGSY